MALRIRQSGWVGGAQTLTMLSPNGSAEERAANVEIVDAHGTYSLTLLAREGTISSAERSDLIDHLLALRCP